MAVYFASDNTTDSSRNGQIDHPFLDPSELPQPWTAQSGTEYLFRCDTETNFLNNFRSLTETASKITIGWWGSGAKPIITAYRMLAANECVECDVDNSGDLAVLTIPPVGGAGSTNLWRVPKTFFGLFGDGTWGTATDVANRSQFYGKFIPSAPREWCGAVTNSGVYGVTDGYGVIYSVGNPVETFGGVYVSSFPEGTWNTAGYKDTFNIYRPKGGYEISGLDLRKMYAASMCRCSSAINPYVLEMERVSSNDLLLTDLYIGVSVTGAYEYNPNILYKSLRHYDCYGENIGNSFFNTSGPKGMRVRDARVYRHVVNGCTMAYGSGGFYIPSVRNDQGERMLVEDCTVYGAQNGSGDHPYWPTDGHAFYQEINAQDLEWRRCVSWGSRLNFIGNGGARNCVWTDCIATALAPVENGGNHFAIQLNDGRADELDQSHRGLVQGMVAVGFQQFAVANVGTTAAFKFRGNISLGSGQWAGDTASTQAIEGDSHDPALIEIDGNNFYGHSHGLHDWNASSYDSPPYVNNKITASPAAEIARLPRVLRQAGVTPTEAEKRVNYALQIRPGARIVSGVVDLRPGTRVVV